MQFAALCGNLVEALRLLNDVEAQEGLDNAGRETCRRLRAALGRSSRHISLLHIAWLGDPL